MQKIQDMCPICTYPFKEEEVIVQYFTWKGNGKTLEPRLGHVDCILYLSKIEERDHPPTR